MKKDLMLPEYLFEISWEVCNKVGGIYTVVSTKARTLSEVEGLNTIYIGPDLWKEKENPLFTEDKRLWSAWRKSLSDEKLTVRCGYWEIPGRPKVILVDYTGYMADKDAIYGELWNDFAVDSLHGYGDYDDSMIFGYSVGRVIESFYKKVVKKGKAVVQAHEWQSGGAALYIKKNLPEVGTIFTTHATSIGRSIASNGKPLYDYFEGYNGDQMAAELNVQSKHSVEKQTAHNVDCFTTVSDLTARECEQLIERKIDVVLENGFEKDFVPSGAAFTSKRKKARELRIRAVEALTGTKIGDDALLIGLGGRMEMRNKGIDLFLQAMRGLRDQKELDRDIIAFIDVPAWMDTAREDLCERLAQTDAEWDTPLENPFITHKLHNTNEDAVVCAIRSLGLDRIDGSRVKVVYVPCYLNGSDGVFNMNYYDALIGNDLSVYPSYYEPWGYTPLESVAFRIPTITTNLAGFGLWVNSLLGRQGELNDGVEVIERTDSNYFEMSDVITKTICTFAAQNKKDVDAIRKKAAKIADKALWKCFILNYFNAYDHALRQAEKRKDL
ncbi:MAG: glycogen/starch synthase [Bacteroidaceae bacterium]|nr:glycogen/starch synthase [Bacteroidaceae bacterium]